jgi:hypothetical protein
MIARFTLRQNGHWRAPEALLRKLVRRDTVRSLQNLRMLVVRRTWLEGIEPAHGEAEPPRGILRSPGLLQNDGTSADGCAHCGYPPRDDHRSSPA